MTWKSYFASPSPFQICHFKHTRFNFLIGLNFSFRLSRGGGEGSRARQPRTRDPAWPAQPARPGSGADFSGQKTHEEKKKIKKNPRRPFSDLLFLVSRGAVAAPKGLNCQARIFEFVTVFNSQKSQTNTGLIRQRATAPASQQHPTEPSRDIPLKGTTGAPAEPRCGAGTATRGWVVAGSSRVRRVTRAAQLPSAARGRQSFNIYYSSSPLPRGWKGVCGRTGGMCEIG